MSRPKSPVLLTSTDYSTGVQTDIIAAEGMFYVTYCGSVFNVKVTNTYTNASIKYPKVAFANKGHAIGLAKKMNKKFNCNDFSVIDVLNKKELVPPMPKEVKHEKASYDDIAQKLLEAAAHPRSATVIYSVKRAK